MTPDLSSFYYHALAYSDYVLLAYGASVIILGALLGSIWWRYCHIRKTLASFKKG